MKNTYKYDENIDINRIKSINAEAAIIPFFENIDYKSISSISNISSLIDPLLALWNSENHKISDMCENLFKKEISLKSGVFYLGNKPILPHERMIIQILMECDKSNKDIVALIPKEYNNHISPFYYEDHINTSNSITFLSNDMDWISIFNNAEPETDFFWVESDFDVFTYEYLKPGNYRVASGWANIVKILRLNCKHKGIIDKDGFTLQHKKSKLFPDGLNICLYSECENIWLNSSLLATYSLIDKKFNKKNYMNYLLSEAFNDFHKTFDRFTRRQDILKENNLPFLNKDEIKILFDTYRNNIEQKNYDEVIKYYDNKSMFNLLLKNISCNNINDFYRFLSKNKKHFNKNNLDLIF